MRNLLLLLTCLGLFGLLAYFMFQQETDTPKLLAPQTPASLNASGQHNFALRLDTRLNSIPSQPPSTPKNWFTKIVDMYESRENRTSIAFLTAALLLGATTGLAWRTQSASESVATDQPIGETAEPSFRDTPSLAELTLDSVENSNQRELEQVVTTLREQTQSYELELSEAAERLKDHETIIDELRDELSLSEKVRIDLDQRGENVQEIRAEISERDQIIAELHEDIENWRQQWKSQEDVAYKLNEQILVLKADNDNLYKKIQDEQEINNTLVQEKEELGEQVHSLSKDAQRVEELDSQLNELVERYQDISAVEQSLREDFDAIQPKAVQFDEITERFRKTNDELLHTKNELQHVQEKATTLETSQSHYQRDVELLRQQLDQLEDENNELNNALTENRTALESIRDESEGLLVTIEQLRTEIGHLTEERDQLATAFSRSEDALDDAQEKSTERSNEIRRLREETNSLANQLDEKDQTVREWELNFQSLSNELNDQSNHVNELNAEIEALGQEKQEVLKLKQLSDQHLYDAEQRIDHWDNSVATYRNEIESKNHLIDSLRDETALANERADELKKQLRNIDTQLGHVDEVREEMQIITAGVNDMAQDWTLQDKQIEQLEDISRDHAKRIERTIRELSKVTSKFASHTKRVSQINSTVAELQSEVLEKHALLHEIDEQLILALSLSNINENEPIPTFKENEDSIKIKAASVLRTIEDQLQLATGFEGSNIELEEKIEQLQDELKQQHQIHGEQLEDHNERATMMAQQLDDAVKEKTSLLAQLQGLQESVEESEANTRERLQEKDEHVTSLNQLLIEKTEENDARLAELQTLQSALEEIESSARQQLQNKDASIDHLTEQLNMKSEESEARLTLLQSLQDTLENTESNTQRQQQTISSLTEETAALRAKKTELSSVANQLTIELSELQGKQQHIEKLETILADTEKEREHYQQKSSQLRTINEKLGANIRLLQQQLAQPKHLEELETTKRLCKELQQQLHKQKTINHKIGQRVLSLQDQLKQMQASGDSVPVLTNRVKSGQNTTAVPILSKPLKNKHDS